MNAAPILDGLLSPADLQTLSDQQLLDLAEEIRTRIKEVVSDHGGHLASNLGVVELTLALHRCFDFSEDKLLWDVGHQAYPHKLLTGRAEQFATNRQQGGLSGFPDPKESHYDIAKVGHSSTAISTAVGLAHAYKLAGQKRQVVAVVGDGALTGGMCYEAFLNAGHLQVPMLVILNDNGSFIDAPVGSLHEYLDHIRSGKHYNRMRDKMLQVMKRIPGLSTMERMAEHAESAARKLVSPGFIFEDLGFKYYGPIDGHNRVAVERMLKQVAQLDRPVLLHVHTQKGGGWAPSAEDPLTFHGPKGFDPDTGVFSPVKKVGRTYSEVFAHTLIDLARGDEKVVALTAAMPSGTGLRQFAQEFPDRSIDVGICEQHSFGHAQGMAVAGLCPVLAHYSTFAQRGYDQLFQEFIVQRDLGMIMVLDRAGLVGPDGETHQGLYDIAWSRTLPGTVLMSPKDAIELRAMLTWAYQDRQQATRPAAYIIRYPRETAETRGWGLDKPTPIALGKAEPIRLAAEPRLMVWAYGPMLSRVVDAVASLGDLGQHVSIVNARFAKPIDQDCLVALAAQHAAVVTVEDHAIMGGFGSALSEQVHQLGLSCQVHHWGVDDSLVAHATREEQITAQGLDVASMAQALGELLGEPKQAIPFPRQGGVS